MRLAKILYLVLVMAMLCCSFIACEGGSEGEDLDIDLPERDFYTVTVSFQIKDPTGKTVIEALDYKYKGHDEPTIINVVETYLNVVADWTCKIDKSGKLTQIGGMKAGKYDYWGFVTNVSKNEKTGEITLKDASAINLSLEQINKQQATQGTINDTMLIDGAEFTLILVTTED